MLRIKRRVHKKCNRCKGSYITGDLPYHEISSAVQMRISMIAVDQDESEKFFVDGII